MDNVLEKQRRWLEIALFDRKKKDCLTSFNSAHEDLERLEQAIVDQYMEDAKTHRERLFNEHVVDKFLTRIAEKSTYLLDLYEDKSGQVLDLLHL